MGKRINSEFFGIILFIISTAFALFLAFNLYQVPGFAEESNGISFMFVVYYIIIIVVFTVIALYLIKRHANIMKAIFIALVLYMIFLVSSIVAGIVAVNLPEYYAIIAIITGFFAYMLIFRNEWYITDAAGLIMISGASSILGILLRPDIAITLLIVFALYDYIAVYKTKHMVTLAKAAVDNQYPLMFTLPSERNTKIKDMTFENRGEHSVIMLGFGDMAIPEILIVSSAIYYPLHIILFAGLTLAGAIAALIFLFFFNNGKPAPGLPYINTGVIAGFLIALVVLMI
ncbi:presenilin family intramembrane aspartyl protease PSH [Ferroplasma sp.]|uniref:presenilin family intramembrane aspartyl protease PSH n=1 Tax=Ferroplasma sp. TaxID=2591003 RepID=UPI00307FCBE3